MKILGKMIDCKSLKKFDENVYGRVYFNKVASLHCTDCNSTIDFSIDSFRNIFLKIAVFKIF